MEQQLIHRAVVYWQARQYRIHNRMRFIFTHIHSQNGWVLLCLLVKLLQETLCLVKMLRFPGNLSCLVNLALSVCLLNCCVHLRNFAFARKSIAFPEILCVSLQNYWIPPRNFVLTCETFAFFRKNAFSQKTVVFSTSLCPFRVLCKCEFYRYIYISFMTIFNCVITNKSV